MNSLRGASDFAHVSDLSHKKPPVTLECLTDLYLQQCLQIRRRGTFATMTFEKVREPRKPLFIPTSLDSFHHTNRVQLNSENNLTREELKGLLLRTFVPEMGKDKATGGAELSDDETMKLKKLILKKLCQ